MTSLLTKLPRMGFRPASGLSSRLGCHVLGRRGPPNAVVRPWATRQQTRFLSNDTKFKYDNPNHYATLGVKSSATQREINEAWAEKWKKLHSDTSGSENKRATEEQIQLQDASDILRDPERRAKYDAQHGYNQPAQPVTAKKQPSAARTQRGGIGLKASLLQEAAKAREQKKREEARSKLAARAAAEAQAAAAKKRDEARRAQELADRAASIAKAEAEAEKKRAEENDPVIRAARAAEKEKAEKEEAARRAARAAEKEKAAKEEAAREEARAAKKKAEMEAAKRTKAIARARQAELVSQREGRKRLVVLRHVPDRASAYNFTQALKSIQAGRILDVGCERGTAWVEFFTAEQARAFHRLVTETGWFTICDTRILTAELRQGTVTPPQGPELITRCLHITMPAEFLDFQSKSETLEDLMGRKLRERRLWVSSICYTWGEMDDGGMWLVRRHYSVAHARSVKAAIEKDYPQLRVSYVEDNCGGLPQTPREDTLEASGIDKKKLEAGHSLVPRPSEIAVAAVFAAIASLMGL